MHAQILFSVFVLCISHFWLLFECFQSFLNLKIQEGEAHNIFCPAFDCYQLVPVEVIEGVVSREMDKRYLQFDIKVVMKTKKEGIEMNWAVSLQHKIFK